MPRADLVGKTTNPAIPVVKAKSKTIQDQSIKEEVSKVLALLIEYTVYWRVLTDSNSKSIKEPRSYISMDKMKEALTTVSISASQAKALWHNLKGDHEDLVRHASQLIEHGKLGISDRLEMRIRLAEFEAALEAARDLFDT